jgi:hypothetical protein
MKRLSRESYVNKVLPANLIYSKSTPGTDVMIFKKKFAEKISEKNGVFDSKQS